MVSIQGFYFDTKVSPRYVLLIVLSACFQMKHSKSYTNFLEDSRRMNTYFGNSRRINEHNALYDAGNVTYRMSLNEYSDLSHDEFVSQMNGAKRPPPK